MNTDTVATVENVQCAWTRSGLEEQLDYLFKKTKVIQSQVSLGEKYFSYSHQHTLKIHILLQK